MPKLFPLPLHALGTADVESFASYTHRAAYWHGVNVGALIKFAYASGNELRWLKPRSGRTPAFSTVSSLVRPSRNTLEVVRVFEQLTGQSLQAGVLHFLDFEFPVRLSGSELQPGFRWCPECFREMELVGQERYFKLIWHLNAIPSCPIHRTPLCNMCTFCGCDQTTLVKKRPIGICQNCGQSLAKRKDRLRASDVTSSWKTGDGDILCLFMDLADEPFEDNSEREITRSICGLSCQKEFDGGEEFLSEILWSTGMSNSSPRSCVSLKTARRLAHRLGVTLYTLISGNAKSPPAMLDSEWTFTWHETFVVAKRNQSRNHAEVMTNVKAAIRNQKEPMSLKELARKVKVSVGYLEYRYPILVKNVVRNYQEHIEHCMLRKRFHAQASALAYFFEEKYQAQPKSRKQAYRVLKAETGLPKFMLKRAIQTAYNAMH